MPDKDQKPSQTSPKPSNLPDKTSELDPLDENIRRFSPYLNEIQQKLFQVIVVFFVFGLAGGIYYQQILRGVMHLFNLQGVNIVMTNPYQFISLAVNTGITIGAIASLVPLFIHLISFLKPALKPDEYKLVTGMVPSATALFVVGFAFGVWVVQFVITLFSKTTLEFAVENLWDISHFFGQIILTGLILALVFQLPIIVTALLRFNIVKYELLVKQRRYVYASLLLIAALMPPTDILSLILLTVPPLLLFEIALVLNHPNRLPQVGKKEGK